MSLFEFVKRLFTFTSPEEKDLILQVSYPDGYGGREVAFNVEVIRKGDYIIIRAD